MKSLKEALVHKHMDRNSKSKNEVKIGNTILRSGDIFYSKEKVNPNCYMYLGPEFTQYLGQWKMLTDKMELGVFVGAGYHDFSCIPLIYYDEKLRYKNKISYRGRELDMKFQYHCNIVPEDIMTFSFNQFCEFINSMQ